MNKRWYQHSTEQIYAYRTDKPYGWGRHWAYVGRTNNPYRRHREHIYGIGPKPAKPWADLRPKRYIIFKQRRRMEVTTHFLEWFTIRLLWPVYNISMNYWNPRRIKPWTQVEQRALRDRHGHDRIVRVSKVLRGTVLLFGAFFAGAILISRGVFL